VRRRHGPDFADALRALRRLRAHAAATHLAQQDLSRAALRAWRALARAGSRAAALVSRHTALRRGLHKWGSACARSKTAAYLSRESRLAYGRLRLARLRSHAAGAGARRALGAAAGAAGVRCLLRRAASRWVGEHTLAWAAAPAQAGEYSNSTTHNKIVLDYYYTQHTFLSYEHTLAWAAAPAQASDN
jgi:hypothetical protein